MKEKETTPMTSMMIMMMVLMMTMTEMVVMTTMEMFFIDKKGQRCLNGMKYNKYTVYKGIQQ